MAAVVYNLVEPIKDPKQATEFLAKNFLPLFNEYWEAEGQNHYGEKIWDIKAVDFTELWMRGTLTLILAKEGDSSVGFILGAILRPLLYETRLLRVETWYGRDLEIEQGMFEYLENGLKFMQINEILIPRGQQLFNPKSYVRSDIPLSRYLKV